MFINYQRVLMPPKTKMKSIEPTGYCQTNYLNPHDLRKDVLSCSISRPWSGWSNKHLFEPKLEVPTIYKASACLCKGEIAWEYPHETKCRGLIWYIMVQYLHCKVLKFLIESLTSGTGTLVPLQPWIFPVAPVESPSYSRGRCRQISPGLDIPNHGSRLGCAPISV